MHWLNAALAFAITMLILSMVVSTLVETLHRFLRLRADGLRIMLGKLFDDVVAPHFAFAQAESCHDMHQILRLGFEPAGSSSHFWGEPRILHRWRASSGCVGVRHTNHSASR